MKLSPMDNAFEWPVPASYELVPKFGLPISHGNPGVVVLQNGQRLGGKFLQLDPAQASLCFLPQRATEPLHLGFADFKSLQVYSLATLKPLLVLDDEEPHAVLPRQGCTIHFVDGETLHLDAVATVEQDYGLFLFLHSHGSNIFQYFIPVQAMRSYDLGNQKVECLLLPEEALSLAVPDNVLSFTEPEKVSSLAVPDNFISFALPEEALSLTVADSALSVTGTEQVSSLVVPDNSISFATPGDLPMLPPIFPSDPGGEQMSQDHITTREQIESALEKRKNQPVMRIGEILIKANLITSAQLDEALRIQRQDRSQHLGEILVRMGAVDEVTLRRVLARKMGIPFVDLDQFECDLNLVRMVSSDLARKHCIMPLYMTSNHVVVATDNPFTNDAMKSIGLLMRMKVHPVMASAQDIKSAIQQYYGLYHEQGSISELVLSMQDAQAEPSLEDEHEYVSDTDNVLVRLVNKLIVDAYESGASDIHIESMRDGKPSKVRFRKDGILRDYSDIPSNFRNALISRIKIMARLDISEKRHAQDGKIDFQQFGPRKIELRVVTIPLAQGLEDIVMRILTVPEVMPMDQLGLVPRVLKELHRMVERPHGLMFVCGPTGSGKTTTLHALLRHINTPERKIWTVEDPIEITQQGLRQVQVQSKIGWDFASVLRSLLRADPDVIMVGEIRDAETGKIALEASLTGHLVLATMHTNSAVESVIRMLDLGMDPFNFADALLGVAGQRLVRKFCPSCRQPYQASAEEIEMLAHEYCFDTPFQPNEIVDQWRETYSSENGTMTLYRAQGCRACEGSGYKGRIGIYELFANSPRTRRKIQLKATVQEIFQAAAEEGMRNLRQDGIGKILQGHTDWEQIKAL